MLRRALRRARPLSVSIQNASQFVSKRNTFCIEMPGVSYRNTKHLFPDLAQNGSRLGPIHLSIWPKTHLVLAQNATSRHYKRKSPLFRFVINPNRSLGQYETRFRHFLCWQKTFFLPTPLFLEEIRGNKHSDYSSFLGYRATDMSSGSSLYIAKSRCIWRSLLLVSHPTNK